jgi:hypothetical protein
LQVEVVSVEPRELLRRQVQARRVLLELTELSSKMLVKVEVEVPVELVSTDLSLVMQLLLGEEVLITREIHQFTDQEIPLKTMLPVDQLVSFQEEPVELRPLH